MLNLINSYMKQYNWTQIQQDYDTGLSQRKLCEKYGMSSRTLTNAVRRGDLKTRTKSEAAKIDNANNPRTHTEQTKELLRKKPQKIEVYHFMFVCRRYGFDSRLGHGINKLAMNMAILGTSILQLIGSERGRW